MARSQKGLGIVPNFESGGDSGISRRLNSSMRILSSPVPSENPAQRGGWLVPLAWEFISEVWECERKPVRETVYVHEGEVTMIRE